MALKLTGHLDERRLQRAIAALIKRQQMLRAAFDEKDGRSQQFIAPDCEADFAVLDLSFIPEDRREPEARQLIRMEATQPFVLEKPPLIRVRLLRFSATVHVLCLILHHIIADLWAMKVLWRDLARIYDDQVGSRDVLATQYLDYALQQRKTQDENRENRLGYLRHWARDVSGYTHLPVSDKDSPRVGRVVSLELSERVTFGVRKLSRTYKTTVFMTLLTMFVTALQRHWQMERFLVGAMVANRPTTSLEPIVGVFATSLALKLTTAGTNSLAERLSSVRDTCFDAYSNQPLPLWQLAELTNQDLDPTLLRPRVSFTLQTAPVSPYKMLDVDVQNYFANGATIFEGETAVAPFDQAWEVWEDGAKYKITVIHRQHLAPSVIDRLLASFQEIISSAIAENEGSFAEVRS